MIKIGIFSDLHLDHAPYNFFFDDYDVDIWINAGDTATNTMLFDYVIKKKCPDQVYVMGNHDFYGKEIKSPQDYCNTSEKHGLKIASAPLWTELSNPIDWIRYSKGLVDVGYIGKKQWTQDVYMQHHEYQKAYLLDSGADIIVSHHAPSYQSVGDQFRGDVLNCCFATELSEHILSLDKPPKLWVHGHMHNKSDYMIGETRVICHPRGYPKECHFNNYEPLLIEV